MAKITLKFPSLQLLADCLFQLSITRPVIDYDNYTFTADLTDEQVKEVKNIQGEIVEQVVIN